MTVRSDIADFLETAGVSPVVYSFHDTAPNAAVALFPYPGAPPMYTKSGPGLTYPRLQVVARGTEEGAEALILSAYTALESFKSPNYTSVRMLTSPFRDPSGADGEGRVKFMFNVEITK